ncbi:hypothetical protein THAOC_24439, partial [Thalassiosira oceanica]
MPQMRRVFISVPTQSKDPVKSQSKAPTSTKEKESCQSRKQYPFQQRYARQRRLGTCITPCTGLSIIYSVRQPCDQSQSPVVLSEELDPVLLGRLPLEHPPRPRPGTTSLSHFDYARQSTRQFRAVCKRDTQNRRRLTVDVLPRVELVQRADAVHVAVRGRPVVQVGGELVRPPPEDAHAGPHAGVLPLAVSAVHEVVGDGRDVGPAELPADRVVPPEGAVVQDERLDLEVGVFLAEQSADGKKRRVSFITPLRDDIGEAVGPGLT